jgi:hypothetical protein
MICIGAPNQRKLLCDNDLTLTRESPDADRLYPASGMQLGKQQGVDLVLGMGDGAHRPRISNHCGVISCTTARVLPVASTISLWGSRAGCI